MKEEGGVMITDAVVPPKEELIDSYWVSDGLEPYFRRWIRQNPVLISAQTGRGKNHFIMKKLIPFAPQQRSGWYSQTIRGEKTGAFLPVFFRE